jgi:hypothetical protein
MLRSTYVFPKVRTIPTFSRKKASLQIHQILGKKQTIFDHITKN